MWDRREEADEVGVFSALTKRRRKRSLSDEAKKNIHSAKAAPQVTHQLVIVSFHEDPIIFMSCVVGLAYGPRRLYKLAALLVQKGTASLDSSRDSHENAHAEDWLRTRKTSLISF